VYFDILILVVKRRARFIEYNEYNGFRIIRALACGQKVTLMSIF